MKNEKIKNKLNRLLNRYSGRTKKERIDALALDLHIKNRWLTYLLAGQKQASYHLEEAIDRLLSK